jgi:glutaredoxin
VYVRSLGVNLIEHNIETDQEKKEEMKKKSGGSTSVPLLDIEGQIIRGYSQEAIKSAIERSLVRR